jgi:hypothetical protein
MSRKLDRQNAEAKALRTLDGRRQAQAQAQAQAPRPAPGLGQPVGSQPDNARMPPQGYGSGPAWVPAPAQAQAPTQVPIIVRQDSGLGHVVAGAIIARSAANAHANNNNNGSGYYPAPGGGGGDLAAKAGADAVDTAAGGDASGVSVSDAVVVIFVWLCFLALAAWVLYTARKRAKSRRDANKPNYSFERN